MPLEQSILKSTKKILGYEHDSAFDLDVITHINSAFFTLYQLGIGPPDGFAIEDETAVWEDFTDATPFNINSVRTFIYLKVRLYFDPPGTPHHLTAMKDQETELIYRLKMERELAVGLGGRLL